MLNVLYVAIGGAFGSVMRYLIGMFIGRHVGNEFPYSTLIINISGSVLMGLLVGWLGRVLPSNAGDLRLLLAIGILGGYTTFSSFSLDAITLFEEGKITAMAGYIVLSVTLSLAGLIAGLYIMRSLV